MNRIQGSGLNIDLLGQVRKSDFPKHPSIGASATKAVKTSTSKEKLMSNRALNNIQLPGRASTKAFSPFKTKLFPKRSQGDIQQPERAPSDALETIPSKKKLLAKWFPKISVGAGPTETVKTGPSKKKLIPNLIPNRYQTSTTPNYLSGLLLSCQDGPFKTKLLPNRAHGNTHQPDWPIRRLSRRQKNC